MASLQSPPISQEEDLVMMDSPTSNPVAEKIDDVTTQENSNNTGTSTASSNGLGSSNTSTSHGAPGSGWQTKKYQEEYDRSMAQLMDQKWSMASFPDPLLKK